MAPALSLAIWSLAGERRRAEYVTARMAELDEPPARSQPRVALIVPPPAAAETRAALAAQDYPNYEIVATEQEAPAGSEIVAFGPESGSVPRFWLRALVAPFSDPGVTASSGFRWYAPEPPTFWSLVRSVWSGTIAGRLQPGRNAFVWRGAMAVRIGADAAANIAFAPGAVVVDSTRTTMRAFLRQASRDMAFARRQYPWLWFQALIAHVLYCGAMLAAAIASYQGHRGAEWALVVQFGLGMLKGANRATLAKVQMRGSEAWFDRYSWTHIVWVPIVTWVWLFVLIASLFC